MEGNTTMNETSTIEVPRMSKPVASIMRAEGLTIVALNLMVVLTLLIKKTKFPAVYWLQLFCLALNDMLAGIAIFLISFIDMPYIGHSLVTCASIVAFMYTSQSASLYNIFGISVHRFMVLKRYNSSRFIWKHYYTILCTITAWTMSAILCSLPLILYHKTEGYAKMKYCSLKPIFGEDIRKGILIMVVGSFIFPLVFINIIYLVLFCKLRSSGSKIRPIIVANKASSNSVSTIPTLDNCYSDTTTQTARCSTSGETVRFSTESFPRKTIQAAPIENKYLRVPDEGKAYFNKATIKSTLIILKSSAKHHGEQSLSSQESLAMIRQRKAFTLLGIILLFLNIFSWPGVASLVMTSMVGSISLGRNTLLPLFTTICLNSAVNPLLYAVRIPEFRASLVEILNSLYKLVACKTRSNSRTRH